MTIRTRGSNDEDRLVVSPCRAWKMLGCGNTHGYELLADGELESYKDGRSRRITVASIHDYIARGLAAGKSLVPTRKRQARKAPTTRGAGS